MLSTYSMCRIFSVTRQPTFQNYTNKITKIKYTDPIKIGLHLGLLVSQRLFSAALPFFASNSGCGERSDLSHLFSQPTFVSLKKVERSSCHDAALTLSPTVQCWAVAFNSGPLHQELRTGANLEFLGQHPQSEKDYCCTSSIKNSDYSGGVTRPFKTAYYFIANKKIINHFFAPLGSSRSEAEA